MTLPTTPDEFEAFIDGLDPDSDADVQTLLEACTEICTSALTDSANGVEISEDRQDFVGEIAEVLLLMEIGENQGGEAAAALCDQLDDRDHAIDLALNSDGDLKVTVKFTDGQGVFTVKQDGDGTTTIGLSDNLTSLLSLVDDTTD